MAQKDEQADSVAAFLFLRRLINKNLNSNDKNLTALDRLILDVRNQLGSKIQNFRKYLYLLNVPEMSVSRYVTEFKPKNNKALVKMNQKLKESESFKDFYVMLESKFKYCSTQIDIEPYMANRIFEFGNEIVKDSDLYSGENQPRQPLNDIHCTVCYGLKLEDEKEVKRICGTINPFVIELGDISFFDDKPECTIIKINVKSRDLKNFHNIISNTLQNYSTYSEFLPHVTIAFAKKTFDKSSIQNLSKFDGIKIPVFGISFSDQDGNKTIMPLGRG